MLWLNLVIFALLVIGHTELLVTLVNRVHALRIHCRHLERLRHVHDLMIPVFPFVLLWFVGLRGPGVLIGGSWRDLSLGWSIYLTLCGLGTLGFFWAVIRWRLKQIPRIQLSNHTEIVDVADKIGHLPINGGPFRFLARLPLNEICQLEVSQKTYRLPRLTVEWHGLKILHLTDFHYVGTLEREFFEHICELGAAEQPDMIVFTGDLLDRQSCIEWLPSTLGRLTAPLGCYFILGNHDWYLEPSAIRNEMSRLGWHDVAGRTVHLEHQGRTLAIAGTEVPWMGEHPDWSTAPEEAFRLLLSHTPDHLEWAREQQVDLMLSGHNHGGQVVLPVIGPVYAPSRYGVKYASGVFWSDPTLLYVSRGISGRHPLRIGCRPELTTLVLEAGE